LRIDPLLVSWKTTAPLLAKWGYSVTAELNAKTISEVRRFFEDWTKRMNARFLMVSLAPEFEFPSQDDCAQLIEKAVVPHCRDFGLPFAVMQRHDGAAKHVRGVSRHEVRRDGARAGKSA
jgi:hypothetical protein